MDRQLVAEANKLLVIININLRYFNFRDLNSCFQRVAVGSDENLIIAVAASRYLKELSRKATCSDCSMPRVY